MEAVNIANFPQQNKKDFDACKPESITTYTSLQFPEQYTIVTRPTLEVTMTIQQAITALKNIESDHFYYPNENLHLTILGGIPTTTSIENPSVLQKLQALFANYAMLFKLQGMRPTSPIIAYPERFSLHDMREEIRKIIGSKGDEYAAMNPYYEHIAWINVVRFLHEPSPEFIQTLLSYNDYLFGNFEATSIELYKTASRVLDSRYSKPIKTFTL